MQFPSRHRQRDDDASLIPLINVVFLLLVFLMIAGALAPAAPFRVDPPISDGDRAAARDGVVVLLDAGGRVALNGREIAAGDLRRALERALAANPDLDRDPVLVRADRALPFARLEAALRALDDTGFLNVALQTRRR